MPYTVLPKELIALPQWVCCYKDSKVPMTPHSPLAASSSDSSTWRSYEEAEKDVQMGYYDNLGFVFNDNGIVGIDIDCGFEDGLMTPLCCDIVSRCRSYTEKSRSGRGVHILLKGHLPFSGKNNLKGVEIYQSKRFFIVTGEMLIYPDMVENQDAIDYVLQTYFPEQEKTGSASSGGQKLYRPVWSKPKDGRISLRPKYPPIPAGGRNQSLASLAGTLHTFGMRGKEILAELNRVNLGACNPPLPDQEVVQIARSITRYRR